MSKSHRTRFAGRAVPVKLATVAAFVVVFGSILAADHEVLGQGGGSAEVQVAIPLGIPRELWESLIPPDNPMTPQKIALGEKIFFDKRLSFDKTISCATCHDPAFGFAEVEAVAIGVGKKAGARNSPTILNAMFFETQFWDGRALTLEEQMKLPLINPVEMAQKDHAAVLVRIREVPEYARDFAAVFPGEGITMDTVAKAVAAFERTRLSGNSPFDRFFFGGNENAMSASAKRGWELFRGKARCIECHAFNATSPFFTDNKFHNIGVAAKNRNFAQLARRAMQAIANDPANAAAVVDQLALTEGFSELGRFMVTRQPKDIGAFKTSALRDVELTAPHMHNGSEKTLLDVVKFYEKGGEPNPNLDGGMRKLNLTDAEMADLVEFLKALTSDDVRAEAKRVKPQDRNPFTAAGSR
jgi:cytochrome c peroxidase